MLHEVVAPATNSRAAPAASARTRTVEFEFRQLVLAMSIGFMVPVVSQVSHQLSEILQATHFESFSWLVEVAV